MSVNHIHHAGLSNDRFYIMHRWLGFIVIFIVPLFIAFNIVLLPLIKNKAALLYSYIVVYFFHKVVCLVRQCDYINQNYGQMKALFTAKATTRQLLY